MEVLEVKAPSKAERRVIYYSCECRVHASRLETSSVLLFCTWRRVSRMKRLWDVIVGGDGFLRPQLRDGHCVFQRRHSGVFLCSYNMHRGGKLCNSDAGTMLMRSCKRTSTQLCSAKRGAAQTLTISPWEYQSLPSVPSDGFFFCQNDEDIPNLPLCGCAVWYTEECCFFPPGWASVCVSLHERVSCVRGESQQSRRVYVTYQETVSTWAFDPEATGIQAFCLLLCRLGVC